MKHLLIILIPLFISCQKQSTLNPAIIESTNDTITSIYGTYNVSGIYPHLTTYTHSHVNGMQSYSGWEGKHGIAHGGQRECGIGALVEWKGKLYMINYAAHEPEGSEHKLYIIDSNLKMNIFKGSVGGTPACRMIHNESEQLFIGPYVVDKKGSIRVISPKEMPGRLTAIARHLTDPANKVYYYDMEGMLYEVDVNSLKPTLLFKNPLPGWHGKGGYTSQGLLVLSNNGENHGSYEPTEHWQIDTHGIIGPENFGILAIFDGYKFKVIERHQFTDITTKNGINAIPNENSPLWAIGWDKRSLRLKVMENKEWHTYLLPKAAYNNDPSHGWFTEWPRIREINDGKFLMDMHGMFFDFPSTFSSANSMGIRPISSHLRYVPDIVYWNNKLILASDETSIQGNPLAGQPQSGLWIGEYADLKQWGPASGYGSVWINDAVKANTPSDPFLFAGFDQKVLHLINHSNSETTINIELDATGTNQWNALQEITVKPGSYEYLLFKPEIKAEWIRLSSSVNSTLTATFHNTTAYYTTTNTDESIFGNIADNNYTGKVSHSLLFSNSLNFNLTAFEVGTENNQLNARNTYELNKFNMLYSQGLKDTLAKIALTIESIWSEDEASVIIKTSEGRLRLPKGNGTYSPKTSRNIREVESERELANIHGTFYEVPLFKVGEEANYLMLRPVASHNKIITDFNTWNGLLVMSGVKMNAKPSNHIIKNKDIAVWVGGIDDLWKLGKPIGEGGVWKNTQIKANTLSDKFLMTGYDRKTLELLADTDVTITVHVYTTQYLNQSVIYKSFQLKAGEKLIHSFPKGYSAHWVQFMSNKDCKATAWLKYE